MRRVFIISPLRGSPQQFAKIEEQIVISVGDWKATGNPDDASIEAFETTLRKHLRAGLFVQNRQHAHFLCLTASMMGFAPFAPHVFYPLFLDDTIESQRNAGIDAGLAWMGVCDQVWAYKRDGVSEGMQKEMQKAAVMGKSLIVPAGWGP